MKVKFDMTTRQKIVVKCLKTSHAKFFVIAIPIDVANAPRRNHTIVKYHIMTPLFPIDIDGVCPICNKAYLHTFTMCVGRGEIERERE